MRAADPIPEPLAGQVLVAVQADGRSVELKDADAAARSARWVVDDEARQRHHLLHEELDAPLASRRCSSSSPAGAAPTCRPRCAASPHLPAVYWLLCAMALAVYLVGIVVLMAKPNGRNLPYALIAVPGRQPRVHRDRVERRPRDAPDLVAHLDLPLRIGFDLFTAAAIVHAARCIRAGCPAHLPSP